MSSAVKLSTAHAQAVPALADKSLGVGGGEQAELITQIVLAGVGQHWLQRPGAYGFMLKRQLHKTGMNLTEDFLGTIITGTVSQKGTELQHNYGTVSSVTKNFVIFQGIR